MGSLADDRRAEIDRVFQLWEGAERERDKHLIRLWELCEPVIKRALQDVAAKEDVSWREWLKRRGLEWDDVRQRAFFAVLEACPRFDREHSSGASFATFAMGYIRGEVADLAEHSPHLTGDPAEALGRAEEEAPHREDLPRQIADLARTRSVSGVVEDAYRQTKDVSANPSRKLRRVAERLREEYAAELEHNAKLQALHIMLIAQSVRAEDHEGKLVQVSTLAHLLWIREVRRTDGMPAESYSAKALARVFKHSPTDKTLAKWLKACDEQGITAENWTPEQLARIITPKRGPAFRGRINS